MYYRVKDRGTLYIIIGIVCLLSFFGGYTIISNFVFFHSSIDDNSEKVAAAFTNEKLYMEYNRHINIKEKTLLKVMTNTSAYIDYLYNKDYRQSSEGNIAQNILSTVKEILSFRGYIKGQLPAVANVINYKEVVDVQQEEHQVPPINDDENSNIPIIGDIIFIDPFVENQQENIKGQDNIDFGKIKENIEYPSKLKVDKNKPYILIYHTHATEVYNPITEDNWHSTKKEYSVITIGNIITDILSQKGHKVKHIEKYHDIPSFNKSYARSLETIKGEINKESNLKLLIDIHRDGIASNAAYIDKARKNALINIDGKDVATFRLVVGNDTPNRKEVLKFAKYIMAVSDSMYPGFCKGIVIKPYGKYNQYMSNHATLLEIGSNLNSIEEAKLSAKYIANVLNKAINNIK